MKKHLQTILASLVLSTAAFAANELKLKPNELGKVMVLMYHQIHEPESQWCRTPEKFREDLELLYAQGYYLVNLVDLVDGKINVPAGKTPVVLTFDDTARGQINKIDGKWDPRSAVGIINDMYAKHPDFGRAGSFYLNPKSEDPKKPGSIPGLSVMLREMVELGYELGNHTVSHPHLSDLDQTGVEKEITGLENWLHKAVPGYQIRTMAMPYGFFPKKTAWAEAGSYNGVSWEYSSLLAVGADPSASPYSSKFHPFKLPRVRGSETLDKPGDYPMAYIRLAMAYFQKHPEQRFVSDGDMNTVTVPTSKLGEIRIDLPKTFKVIGN